MTSSSRTLRNWWYVIPAGMPCSKKEGSKSDRIDARKLAELLRANLVRSVYHGEHGVRKLTRSKNHS